MLIKIKNLKLKTIIGVYEWEEKFLREIIINAEIETDFLQSTVSDDIADTVDYELVSNKIKKLVAQNRYKLIEKLAAEIVNLILEDKKIKRCKVEVDKVGIIENSDSVAVVIEKFN